MSDYVLFTDSTSDITEAMANEMELQVIPFHFVMNGKNYAFTLDQKDMKISTFYERLRNGETSTTAQINAEEFKDWFRPVLQAGKDILYVAFSSGLSGTCHNATIAAKELMEEFPERRLEIFDSLCASMGEGLLAYLVAKKRKAGASLGEAMAFLQETRLHLSHWFTVADLNHLKRSGRLSAGAALVGTMLGIKPVLHVDNEGHLTAVSKVRGRKASLDGLVKQMAETRLPGEDQTVFISHADSLDDAKYVAEEIRTRFGISQIYINFIGPVVGAHAGPGTVALFFLGEHR